jgi:hypothetical protein
MELHQYASEQERHGMRHMVKPNRELSDVPTQQIAIDVEHEPKRDRTGEGDPHRHVPNDIIDVEKTTVVGIGKSKENAEYEYDQCTEVVVRVQTKQVKKRNHVLGWMLVNNQSSHFL